MAAGLQLKINISVSSLTLVIDIGTLLIDIRWATNEQKVQIIRRTIQLQENILVDVNCVIDRFVYFFVSKGK